MPRRLPSRDRELEEGGQEGLEALAVGDVHLDALADAAGPLVEGGLETRRAEGDPGERARVQRVRIPVTVEPRRPDPLEGARGAAPLREVRPLDQTAAGVDARGVGGRHVRRGRHPGQSRVFPEHPAAPAAHPDHGQLSAEGVDRVQVAGEFADRHAVARGQRVEADERGERGVGHVALHALAAQRVRAVEDHDTHARAGARPHRERQRPDEGVIARADVLQVHDEIVEAAQHRRRRPAAGAVQAEDAQPRDRIASRADGRVVLGRAPEAVLRGEQRDQPRATDVAEQQGRVLVAPVHRRLMGEEPDAAAKEGARVVHEDVEPREDTGHPGR